MLLLSSISKCCDTDKLIFVILEQQAFILSCWAKFVVPLFFISSFHFDCSQCVDGGVTMVQAHLRTIMKLLFLLPSLASIDYQMSLSVQKVNPDLSLSFILFSHSFLSCPVTGIV